MEVYSELCVMLGTSGLVAWNQPPNKITIKPCLWLFSSSSQQMAANETEMDNKMDMDRWRQRHREGQQNGDGQTRQRHREGQQNGHGQMKTKTQRKTTKWTQMKTKAPRGITKWTWADEDKDTKRDNKMDMDRSRQTEKKTWKWTPIKTEAQ